MLVRASAYGQQLQTAYQGLGEALPYVDRVRKAVDRYEASAPAPGSRKLSEVRTLAFRDVSFSYRAGVPVLSSLSFEVEAGEAVGVVGPTGAGKSTLVQLLLRLRVPTDGAYLVNGLRAEELYLDDWHRKVAYVPQEPALLQASAADNIRFLRDWLEDAAVERAARFAHIHDEIESWSEGYKTAIGQRADAVSGGQRQRLCLARALADRPEILVLDEPTSALDLHSERLVQQSLEELRGGLTLFVVAHRLSTLALCDRVMVIRDGRLEAFEATGKLYESNAFYRQAVDLTGAAERT
jgi:ABC-type multidrug transport system fused ATPase/permease subunit